MERLIRAGLFGAGLVPVNTPERVARYNSCLETLGLEQTKLRSFNVDGMGWSPEIAAERQDSFYLSAGIANPFAVIITPDQYLRPIYLPFSSYDRSLMKAYFENFNKEIVDITTTAAVGLDIDQELTRYESPLDLLLVNYVVIRSTAGRLTEAARRQQALVKRIHEEETAWMDAALRQELRLSAELYGDLRYRRIDIPDMRYDGIRTFHSRAFGGVFVLRPPNTRKALLVVENSDFLKSPEQLSREDVYHITDKRLVQRLLRERIVTVDLRWYREHLEVLADRKDAFAADLLCAEDPEICLAEMNRTQVKSRVSALNALPRAYDELERLIKLLAADRVPQLEDVSPELKLLLLHPGSGFAETEQEAVWQLICRLHTPEPIRLFASDKNYFYEAYKAWPKAKKEWTIKRISGRTLGTQTR